MTSSTRPSIGPDADLHHPHGLAHDLARLAVVEPDGRRRQALRWLSSLGALGALPLLGCGGSDDSAGTASSGSTSSSSTSSTSTSGSGTSSSVTSCSTIPSETAGPYPGDGTNSNASGTVNVLTQTGIVRSDIRSSFGSLSGTAAGVPLTVTLQLVNTNAACASVAGHAVYLWHCDRSGAYSLYSSGATNQNYLRGVQITDSAGQVSFTTIFPACYSGRWPHIHFEIFSSQATATSGNADIKTSQLALPATACDQVYGTATGYSASVSNFAAISLATDNIFSDGSTSQLASITGNVTDGFAATLVVGVAV